MTDAKRDELLLQIWAKLGEIDTKLNADYRALHGNGTPGLIEKHSDLDKRLTKLEDQHKQEEKKHGIIATWIGLLLTAAGTVYAIFKQ